MMKQRQKKRKHKSKSSSLINLHRIKRAAFAVCARWPHEDGTPNLFRLGFLGAAFYVAPRYLLTAHHCLKARLENPKCLYFLVLGDGKSIQSVREIGALHPGQNYYFEENSDCGLIVSGQRNKRLLPKLSNDDRLLKAGRKVTMYGFPNAEMRTSEGRPDYSGIDGKLRQSTIISVARTDINSVVHCSNVEVLILDADLAPGCSGGPVVDNQSGCVIGFSRGYKKSLVLEKSTQEIVYEQRMEDSSAAITIRQVEDFLADHRIQILGPKIRGR